MARFDLLYEQSFTSASSIVVTHNLNRERFDVRLIITGDPRLSQREKIVDIEHDLTDPKNKCTVVLDGTYTGTIQFIAMDTVQAPVYTIAEKLVAQQETDLAGTAFQKFEYGGQANTGRVLEYVTGEASDNIPFIIIGDGKLRGVTFGAAAVATGAIEVRALRGVSDVLLYTLSFTASDKEVAKPLDIDVLEDDEIYVKVSSGSASKPYVTIYLQTI